MASNDRSGVEGTPIYMAPELFDGSARPKEATDVHALRHDLSSRTPRSCSRETLRKLSSPASGPSGARIGACPIGSLRSFAACGRQTPPLVPSCMTLELDVQRCRCRYGDSDSDDRSFVDEIVRKLSLCERHEEGNDSESCQCD
jgi:hypothetical protein